MVCGCLVDDCSSGVCLVGKCFVGGCLVKTVELRALGVQGWASGKAWPGPLNREPWRFNSVDCLDGGCLVDGCLKI